MAQIETWFSQDLQQAVKVHYIDGNVFSADNNGNILGVNVFDDGEPATLGGTVSASIIRADGATVAATGTLSGNQVSVALPQSAYAVPGVISIVLKLTSGTTVTTLLAVVGNVYQSTTDTVVDPGTIIPGITTLVAEIEAAVASIPADYSNLWTSLAPTFSSSTSYAAGEYVTYNGHVYCFRQAYSGTWDSSKVRQVNLGTEIQYVRDRMIAPAFSTSATYNPGEYVTYGIYVYRFTALHTGAWSDSDVVQVALATELYNLESVFDDSVNIEYTPLSLLVGNWKTGYYKTADGTYDTWSRSICTNEAMQVYADGFIVFAPKDASVKVTEYDASGTFVAAYGEFNTSGTTHVTNRVAVKVTQGHKYQFSLGLFAAGTGSSHLTQAYINQVKIYSVYSDEVSLTNRIRQYATSWQTGYYSDSTGAYDTWTRTICTKNPFIATMDGRIKVISPSGTYVQVTEYNASGTFVAVYGKFNSLTQNILTDEVYIKVTKGYTYHFSIGLYASGTASSYLTQEYLDTVEVYTNIPSGSYDLEPTGDTADRTSDIQTILNGKGSCSLAPGLYCTSGIVMPDNATLQGCGAATELRLLPSSDSNLWTFGDKTFIQETVVTYDTALPAGLYKLTADVVSDDTGATTNGINLYTDSPYVPSQTGAGNGRITRGAGQTVILIATSPFKAIGLYSSVNYSSSEGKTATFSNVTLTRISTAVMLSSNNTVKNMLITGSADEIEVPTAYGNRNGIGYYGTGSGSTIKRGIIDGCFIRSFAGGGIDLNNTGYGTQGLNVCNCYVWNCYCGFHGVHFTEFHRVTGCSFVANYIGIMNNGGNNQFTSCNSSGNVYGMVMDNSSGTHNNGAHGGCVGCIFQHNSGTTIYINTEVSGFTFSGCNIDPDEDGQTCVEVVNSSRIIFNACNFMAYFKGIVNGGNLVLFNACNFRTTLTDRFTVTSNNAVRFTSCYTSDGTEVNPVA